MWLTHIKAMMIIPEEKNPKKTVLTNLSIQLRIQLEAKMR